MGNRDVGGAMLLVPAPTMPLVEGARAVAPQHPGPPPFHPRCPRSFLWGVCRDVQTIIQIMQRPLFFAWPCASWGSRGRRSRKP